jgi:hypothetical protein
MSLPVINPHAKHILFVSRRLEDTLPDQRMKWRARSRVDYKPPVEKRTWEFNSATSIRNLNFGGQIVQTLFVSNKWQEHDSRKEKHVLCFYELI